MSDQTPVQVGWGAKLLLVLFGLILGLGGLGIGWSILQKQQAGTTFSNLTDLRRQMIHTEEDSPQKDSVTLRTIVAPHPDDQIVFDLKPNLSVRFQRAAVRTNSCGMRGPEVSIKKPPGTYRIAMLGDSFTFGWGVEEDQSFAARLSTRLNARGIRPVEVLNFGVPGYSTYQEVAKFEETALDLSPDAVIVFFVENDFGLPFFIRDESAPKGGIQSVLSFIPGHASTQAKLSEAQNKQVDPNKALRKLANLCRREGIKLFVAFNPKKSWIDDYKKLWIMRERRDIQLMNLRPEFEETMLRRGIVAKDLSLSFDPHPSPLKHELIGDLMSQYFLSIL